MQLPTLGNCLGGGAARQAVTPERILNLGFGLLGRESAGQRGGVGRFHGIGPGPPRCAATGGPAFASPARYTGFLNALVALGMLEREKGTYSNTAESDLFLDRVKPTYMGGLFEMAGAGSLPRTAGRTATHSRGCTATRRVCGSFYRR